MGFVFASPVGICLMGGILDKGALHQLLIAVLTSTEYLKRRLKWPHTNVLCKAGYAN